MENLESRLAAALAWLLDELAEVDTSNNRWLLLQKLGAAETYARETLKKYDESIGRTEKKEVES